MCCVPYVLSLRGINPMIWLAGSGDSDILNVMPFFKASLGAGVVVGRHQCLWSDSSGTSITLLVKSKLPLFVAMFVPWASLYLVKLISVVDAV
jgi:hypothetical protein